MEFAVLGTTVLRDGAREVALGGYRRRALLALLALHGNRPVGTEQLVQDLWDGNPPAGAVATLHSHVSGLRRVVGMERLRTRAGGYELVVGDDELDASLFEAELTAGGGPPGRGEGGGGGQNTPPPPGGGRGVARAPRPARRPAGR